ncbi:bifunctional 3'-5' exonuclease/DNA polymerase [Streptomyces bohaiensis]|uniref:DNA-directed DNA polymerase n=1 Tax=Streptomyces bohaiensis TaxID=1431344 RepID=A0ABX1CFP7_9ACTN|nr:bifunctional 3'-5' exonuclease/DNA polymerase [Streptomyces bohaiensis]NJQ16998.1 bifunctional 3'-5' exonuclease/DNA polymerase [Streptomyces bohaiensis]
MTAERWAVAVEADGSARCCPLTREGAAAAHPRRVADTAAALRSAPPATRWVWRATAGMAVPSTGVHVARCHDVEAAEAVLLGYEGAHGEPRGLPAAWARLRGLPVPDDPPATAPGDGQPSLFESAVRPGLPPGTDPLAALLEVYAGQLRRVEGTEHPGRLTLLLAAESAGTLVAAEMDAAGLPWRADVHLALLDELLGPALPGGLEPRRLTELAAEVSAAFGQRVRPDLPAEVLAAFRRAGFPVRSTRSWELREIDHPAVAPLLEYKRLYRVHTAHGRAWLRSWVHDGRFRARYVPGGAASGRWTTNGGGALQIPRVVRRAVRADPGWRLVVADAAQLEPRVLAAVSGDRALAEVAGQEGDLYAALSRRLFAGDRERAKLAVLGAVYGQTSGEGLRHLAELRARFPRAVRYVDEAAEAGERGRLVRTHLGRTCPPAGSADDAGAGGAGSADAFPESGEAPAGRGAAARARGRFTRNFVVQGSAAEWALLMLAALRRSLAGTPAELVFFQHDEVIVHCPAEQAEEVAAAVRAAGEAAGRLAFGPSPVRFPFTVAVVESYADAKG